MLLAGDERERAERFRVPEHRHAFIAGRALLRTILGGCCGCAPEALRFTCGDQQNPGIDAAPSHGARMVSFNLSHSTNDLQIAVAADGAVYYCFKDFVGFQLSLPRR